MCSLQMTIRRSTCPVIPILLVALLLASCQPVMPSPTATKPPNATPTRTLTPTITNTPTRTFRPTRTSTQTRTPTPTLSSFGPYLMFDTSYWREGRFVILDSYGNRRLINLPDRSFWQGDLSRAVSPDGKWLVFIQDKYYPDPKSLNLLHIPDGSGREIASLTTSYPDNLSILAKSIGREFPNYCPPDMAVDCAFVTFHYGFPAYAWSPDGQYLAFSAQIDGPSSDLYLYVMKTGEIRRLTADDSRNIRAITWAPSGEGILFRNTIFNSHIKYGTVGSSLHFVTPDEQAIQNPKILDSNPWLETEDLYTESLWLSDNLYIYSNMTETDDYQPKIVPNDLRTLNVTTGEVTHLWRGNFGGYVFDDQNQVTLLYQKDAARTSENGLYFITSEGRKEKITDQIIRPLLYRGGKNSSFLGVDETNNGIVTISPDGSITPLADMSFYKSLSVSPNHSWFILYDDTQLFFFSENDELVRTMENKNLPGDWAVIWHPDASGVYFISRSGHAEPDKLYYFSLPSGELALIYQCQMKGCELSSSDYFTWLP
jgi:dipeptidyl aminopeptidase/acylaminoacyl peptidase